MATVPECITEEQRSIVRVLWVKGLNEKDIHKEMFPVYGWKCLSRNAVHNWSRNCHVGGKYFADEEVETEVWKWLRQKTSMLRVSTHW
jgi:hypothetical protein